MRATDSTINGDVVARDDSSITLIDSVVAAQPSGETGTVLGNVIASGNGVITLINTVVKGEMITEDNG